MNPRTEAAMRKAISIIKKGRGHVYVRDPRSCEVEVFESIHAEEPMAIFDLRDCYRKRAALTGITKDLKKLVGPRRKVKRD